MPEVINATRAAILDRIRRANPAVDAKAREAEYQAIAREYQQSAGMDRHAILNIFIERLREYDAQVHQVTNTNVAEVIGTALADQSGAVVASGFPQEWLQQSFAWIAEADADTAEMSVAEGAVVACEVAIAHTGTIVVKDSRRITLLPDRLLCVVRADQVVETVPEAFARLQPLAADALTFISGPSATADIEMTRIRGVHGPRFLDVVLVAG